MCALHVCALAPPPLPSLPAQLLAALLIQHERLRGVQSSGVLIIFWFLCVICAIIPFRSKILSAMAEVRGKGHLPVSGVTSGLKVTAGSQAPPLHPSLAPRTSSELPSPLWCSLLALCLPRSGLGRRWRWGMGGAEDQCHSGGRGHCWVFLGAQGAVL